MLTCSKAVPQRCFHKTDAPKNAWKPAGEHPCRSMISMELPHSFIKITLPNEGVIHCLCKTRSYSLKDYESVSLKRQSLIFSIVAGSI